MFRIKRNVVVYISRECFVKVYDAKKKEENGASKGYCEVELMMRCIGQRGGYRPCFTDIFVET